ncbi:MAG: GNAT family N-acetyltransferase [Burkholderiales bacterium]
MGAVLRGAHVVLRPWTDADLAPFAAMNADPEVMRHMVKPLTRDESDGLVARIRAHFAEHGFGLWALDAPNATGTPAFAGFVGLSAKVPFDLPVAGIQPAPHEIGWRLARSAWGHGYATEAAALALRYAFDAIGLSQVVSFTAIKNIPSQAVMQRIGLTWHGEFDHPRLAEDHPLRRHVLYAMDSPMKTTS